MVKRTDLTPQDIERGLQAFNLTALNLRFPQLAGLLVEIALQRGIPDRRALVVDIADFAGFDRKEIARVLGAEMKHPPQVWMESYVPRRRSTFAGPVHYFLRETARDFAYYIYNQDAARAIGHYVKAHALRRNWAEAEHFSTMDLFCPPRPRIPANAIRGGKRHHKSRAPEALAAA